MFWAETNYLHINKGNFERIHPNSQFLAFRRTHLCWAFYVLGLCSRFVNFKSHTSLYLRSGYKDPKSTTDGRKTLCLKCLPGHWWIFLTIKCKFHFLRLSAQWWFLENFNRFCPDSREWSLGILTKENYVHSFRPNKVVARYSVDSAEPVILKPSLGTTLWRLVWCLLIGLLTRSSIRCICWGVTWEFRWKVGISVDPFWNPSETM